MTTIHSRFCLPVVLSASLLSVALPAASQPPAPAAQAVTGQASPAPRPPAAPPPAPLTKPVMSETISAAAVRADAGLDRLLPKRAEAIYQSLSKRFQPARAMEVVTFMDRYWRVAGNTGFNASIDHLKAALLEAGYADARPAGTPTAPSAWVEEYPNGGNGWEVRRAEMTIVEAAAGKVPEAVFDPVIDYIAICMNSFPTPPGGVVAPLFYVGNGAEASAYESTDVKGAVVLADGNLQRVWQEAIQKRGAIGVVIAANPPAYTRPDQSPEVFQWDGVPYDDKARAFGFRASRRVVERLRERLRAGAVKVKVDVDTRFAPAAPGAAPIAAGRLLVAEIAGRDRPAERVVMVAHIQEPGANDDASGCGTLLEMARTIQAAIASGAVAPPARTLTFVWGDEMGASREWLRGAAGRTAGTKYMISLDMAGEDTTKTGGSFLIEKEPDPSAVWPRPADPHTEWWDGGGFHRLEALKGSLLNDLYLAVCLRRARDTGWNVQTNPYEGGSDHSVFLSAGVPAALATHFTDRYYHTNLDRPDKTSPAEMANVGIATGTTAMLLASASQEDARAVVDLIARAAANRLAVERRQSAEFLAAAPDGAAAEAGERTVIEAWKRWYVRALESVLTLPAAPADEQLEARVRAAVARFEAAR